jgi:multiple sugar transport system permease protein
MDIIEYLKSKTVYIRQNRAQKFEMTKAKIIFNKIKIILIRIFLFFIVFGISFIILYPLAYMISMSFRNPNDVLDPTVIWIPKNFTFENINTVFKMINYPMALLRTLILSLGCSILQCVSCAIVGYGFARFKFKGREILFILVIFTLIVPPQVITMPLFLTYRNFNFFGVGSLIGMITGTPLTFSLINTPFPLMISSVFASGIRAGLFVYIFRQFFKNMPNELEEAASIDGCSPMKTFIKVMIPNAGPVILVSFLFSLVWYWNDYFNTLMFFNKSLPLSVLLSSLASTIDVSRKPSGGSYMLNEIYVYQQVGCLLFILPLLIIYMFLQKYFTEGVERAGIVG